MAKLPRDLSGQQVRRALERAGFEFQRQRGSHMILERPGRPPIVIPAGRVIRPGLLRRTIRDAGLTVEEFVELL
jgi:predicted RNA binding protein YcfA (HicA-like mRNA interferase family)